ncbi:MAG: 4-(cytidine 5'-diphospho)-2-C-methyl-D-erythritol kinase [Thermoleophilaceae bacterium]
MKVTEHAYAKVNLVLRVGSPRADGLHPLCSIFASLELADLVTVEEAGEDGLVCPGVEGPNLASEAVSAFRSNVPDLVPLKVTIEKRIPVAAGMGGGSADAAAVLRAANELSGARLRAGDLRRLAAGLGSDVASQVEPRHALVSGIGEEVVPLGLPRMALVLLPQEDGLSTARVFEELDRLRAQSAIPRGAPLAPEPLRRLAGTPLAELARGVENELGPAAISLRPELGPALESLRSAGALAAEVTGSGPTTFGLFHDRAAADVAASRLPGAIVTEARAS